MFSIITYIPRWLRQCHILYYVNYKHRYRVITIIIIIISSSIIIIAGLKAVQAGLQSAKINYL